MQFNTRGIPLLLNTEQEMSTGPFLQDVIKAKFDDVPVESLFPQKFVPTLKNVRTYYARQHIPDILEVGPEATPNGYHFVVERGAPESCKKAVDEMYPAAVGKPWNNLLLATNDNSMMLRHGWEVPQDAPETCKLVEDDIDVSTLLQAVQEQDQKSGGNPLTLENVRAYFASAGRGMGIGPNDITALGPEVEPGMYPLLLRNMSDRHVASVRARCPDLPEDFNNFLLAGDSAMVIRFTC